MIRHFKVKHAEEQEENPFSDGTQEQKAAWIQEFSSCVDREGVPGIICNLCNKFFKTSKLGLSGWYLAFVT